MIHPVTPRTKHDLMSRYTGMPSSRSCLRMARLALLCLGLSTMSNTPAAIAVGQDRSGAAAQPSAQGLLAHLAQAATMKGSVHVHGDIDVTVVKLDRRGREHPWMHIVTRSQNDQSYRENVSESDGTMTTASVQNGRTTTQRYRTHQITVGRTSASQSNGGAWSCQTVTSKHLAKPHFSLGLGYPVGSPVNRGPTTVGGIALWHVQGTITTSFYIATSKPVRADYYINRTDGTLVQEHAAPIAEASESLAGKRVPERARGTMSLTYSRWGNPLHVSLPPACRGTS
jgi:hypothetical protein